MADQQQQSQSSADSSALATSSSQPATVTTVRRRGRKPTNQQSSFVATEVSNPFSGLTQQAAVGIVEAEIDEVNHLPLAVNQERNRRAGEIAQVTSFAFNLIASTSPLAAMAGAFANPVESGVVNHEQPIQ